MLRYCGSNRNTETLEVLGRLAVVLPSSSHTPESLHHRYLLLKTPSLHSTYAPPKSSSNLSKIPPASLLQGAKYISLYYKDFLKTLTSIGLCSVPCWEDIASDGEHPGPSDPHIDPELTLDLLFVARLLEATGLI